MGRHRLASVVVLSLRPTSARPRPMLRTDFPSAVNVQVVPGGGGCLRLAAPDGAVSARPLAGQRRWVLLALPWPGRRARHGQGQNGRKHGGLLGWSPDHPRPPGPCQRPAGLPGSGSGDLVPPPGGLLLPPGRLVEADQVAGGLGQAAAPPGNSPRFWSRMPLNPARSGARPRRTASIPTASPRGSPGRWRAASCRAGPARGWPALAEDRLGRPPPSRWPSGPGRAASGPRPAPRPPAGLAAAQDLHELPRQGDAPSRARGDRRTPRPGRGTRRSWPGVGPTASPSGAPGTVPGAGSPGPPGRRPGRRSASRCWVHRVSGWSAPSFRLRRRKQSSASSTAAARRSWAR